MDLYHAAVNRGEEEGSTRAFERLVRFMKNEEGNTALDQVVNSGNPDLHLKKDYFADSRVNDVEEAHKEACRYEQFRAMMKEDLSPSVRAMAYFDGEGGDYSRRLPTSSFLFD